MLAIESDQCLFLALLDKTAILRKMLPQGVILN